MSLSALVLSKNEEEVIENCLKSLSFADEIIILDKGSTDKTLKITKKYTDKIYTTKEENYDKNRNLLSDKAKGDWLLYLDPDERLTEESIEEIKSKKEDVSIYFFPRKNFILGKWLKHGGWWPDYVPRLIKKDNLIKWQGKVHESPKYEGKVAYFEKPIIHLTARSLNKMLSKSIKWGKVEATLYYQAKASKVTIFKVLKSSTAEFIRRYFIKLGILDGTHGLIEAIYQSLHLAIVLVYLWEIQAEASKKFDKVKNE